MAMNVLIGELLIEAGFLSKDDLAEALQIATDTGMRVGRVLIVSGWITEHQLEVALHAQALLREDKLTFEESLAALKIASKTKNNLNQVLTSWEYAQCVAT